MTAVDPADAVVAALGAAAGVLLVTHTHPDGDALGSLTALRLALEARGTRVDVFMSERDTVLPDELEPFRVADPADEHTVTLDDGAWSCSWTAANADRSPLGDRLDEMGVVINIDHHHDNTGSAPSTCWIPRRRAPPRSSGT